MIPETIKSKVEAIKIKSLKMISDHLGGHYRSVFRGGGIEFYESREYVINDDIRHIDWKITARSGKPYVKTFIEERENSVTILSDDSSSEDFGTIKSKREVVAEISGLLAFISIYNSERVGFGIFSDRIEEFVPPSHGESHILGMLAKLLFHSKKIKQTNLKIVLENFLDMLKKRSIVFIISDFLDDNYDKALRAVAKKHDLTAFRVYDSKEENLTEGGLVSFSDIEKGGEFLIDTSSKKVREEYANISREKRNAFENLMKKTGADYLHIDISRDYMTDVVKYFKDRESRYALGCRK